MKIIKDFPPNIEQIKQVLPHKTGYCYCYGEIIYSPDNDGIPDHVVEHEKVHIAQQGGYPDSWWEKYLADPSFRYAQELEAYRVQYKYAKKYIKDRNALSRFLVSLALDLSSDSYGRCVTAGEAMKAIKHDS
jgi:hypothetical protein